MKSTLVIFDFDGTLADTWRDIADALNETLASVGLPAVEESTARFWIGEGVLPLLRRQLGPAATERRVRELYRDFARRYERRPLHHTTLYPGMADALDALRWAKLAILSNKPNAYLKRLLQDLAIASRFEIAFGGDSLPRTKPDPELVRTVVEHIGSRPERIWVVGDSAVDIELGRATEASTIGCAWGLRGRDELVAAGADHVAEHPRELPPLIMSDVAGGDQDVERGPAEAATKTGVASRHGAREP